MRIDIAQLEFIDPMLRTIIINLEKDLGIDFTITSLYRIGDSGVHGQLPLRGIDLRMHSSSIGLPLINYINSEWQYDPSRPTMACAILHDVDGQGLHIHLQTHPRTIRLTEDSTKLF